MKDQVEYGSGRVFGRVIKDFPYKERDCGLCDRRMQLVNAIHSDQDIHHYKAIYVCGYENCPAFDYEGRKAFVKLYYASEEAYSVFEDVLLPVYGRREKTDDED